MAEILYGPYISRLSHQNGPVLLCIDSRDALALFLLQSSQAIKVYCSQAGTHQFMGQPHGWNLSLIILFHRQSAVMDPLLVQT